VRFYSCQLRQLARYAVEHGIALKNFRVVQMRAYMAARREAGLSESTLRHDVVAAKVYFKFLAASDMIPSHPLSAYRVPKMARPYVKCPPADEIQALLRALVDRWNPATTRMCGTSGGGPNVPLAPKSRGRLRTDRHWVPDRRDARLGMGRRGYGRVADRVPGYENAHSPRRPDLR
jgi:hypothetical protein